MSVYTLQGTGERTLSAGTGRLLVEVQAFPPSYSFGKANPLNYYDVGALRVGAAGGWRPTEYIDAEAMLIECPADANQIGYNIYPGGRVQVTEMPSSTALHPLWGVADYDRNALVWSAGARTGWNGGQANVTLFTYTVPDNRMLAIVSARLQLQRFVAAQSANGAYVGFYIGGQELVFIQSSANIVGSGADDWLNGGTLYVPPGTVVTSNGGNPDSGGNVGIYVYAAGYTFDAAV